MSNKKTIESYDAHIDEYINGTTQVVSGHVKDWLDSSLDGLPKNARILEFGSAFGRDAAYIQDKGYSVECTDATPAFVKLLKSKGFNARQLNAITDDLPMGVNLLVANAVLLHFTRDETRHVARKVYDSLENNGRFAFTLKKGTGESWSDTKLNAPRYFCYWARDDIKALLIDVGFNEPTIIEDSSDKWLQIITIKTAK